MSSNSINPHPCSLCGETGHRESRCAELAPQPIGFWKGHRMPDDEGDECLIALTKPYSAILRRHRVYMKGYNRKYYRIMLISDGSLSELRKKHIIVKR